MTTGPLGDSDMRILLRLVQKLEASYLMPDQPDVLIASMRSVVESALVQDGYALESSDQAREQLYRLGVRVRQALGEDLEDDGSPSPAARTV